MAPILRDWARQGLAAVMNSTALAPLRRPAARVVEAALRARHGVVVHYPEPDRARAFDLAWSIVRSGENMLMGIRLNEACQLFMAVERTTKVPGDLAEVGVYRGGSTRLICEAKGSRTLHLFDTFEGLPAVDAIDDRFEKGQYAAPLEEVQRTLAGYPNLHFYKGVFPDTAGPVADRTFSFVHLDVDTHRSTLACLEFFYPRLSPGAVLISHDYANAAGVRKAFDDFFADRREPVLQLSGTQCLVVKL